MCPLFEMLAYISPEKMVEVHRDGPSGRLLCPYGNPGHAQFNWHRLNQICRQRPPFWGFQFISWWKPTTTCQPCPSRRQPYTFDGHWSGAPLPWCSNSWFPGCGTLCGPQCSGYLLSRIMQLDWWRYGHGRCGHGFMCRCGPHLCQCRCFRNTHDQPSKWSHIRLASIAWFTHQSDPLIYYMQALRLGHPFRPHTQPHFDAHALVQCVEWHWWEWY